MIYLKLIYEFFKTGLFSIGGGLATIPFLRMMGTHYRWFNEKTLSDMIAVGESTPGPIGVNMATYVGYSVGGEGVWQKTAGSLCATFALVLPSVIVIILVAKALDKFRQNKFVDSAFYSVRPCVTGMIGAAALSVGKSAFFPEALALSQINYKAVILFAVLLVLTNKIKLHPIFYIVASGAVGALLSL